MIRQLRTGLMLALPGTALDEWERRSLIDLIELAEDLNEYHKEHGQKIL